MERRLERASGSVQCPSYGGSALQGFVVHHHDEIRVLKGKDAVENNATYCSHGDLCNRQLYMVGLLPMR